MTNYNQAIDRRNHGIVLLVDDNDRGIKVGDELVWRQHSAEPIRIDGEDFAFVEFDNIIATLG